MSDIKACDRCDSNFRAKSPGTLTIMDAVIYGKTRRDDIHVKGDLCAPCASPLVDQQNTPGGGMLTTGVVVESHPDHEAPPGSWA